MKNIPVLHVEGKSLAEAYEKALIELYANGCRFKTQYDKPEDPESIDATMNITVEEPMSDPMIHKAFPGGIGDLREYVMEMQGVKDHWQKNMNDPEDTRWSYTYHGRFVQWGQWKELVNKPFESTSVYYFDTDEWNHNPKEHLGGLTRGVNQIETVIGKLIDQPFTRQAQMITWYPPHDLDDLHAPCLQSIWYRMAEEDGVYYLNSNVRIRSNDAFGAYFMNSFGITMFNKEIIADEITRRTGKEVRLARMNWQADSWHIYGKDIQQAKERLFDRLETTEFEDRIFNFHDEMIQEIYHEATPVIEKKIETHDKEQTSV